MTISINHGLHHFQNSCIHSVFRDLCKNQYPMLVILSQLRITQLTGLWLMITFTIYLSNQLTFLVMLLIHVLYLLITAYSFKAYDLIIAIHSIHVIDQSNFIHKHTISKSNKPLHKSDCKVFNKLQNLLTK